MDGFWARVLDAGLPPAVVAEFADSHFGNLERAKAMCRGALQSGATAVKFQHHIVQEEMLESTPMSSNMKEPLWDFLKKNSLDISQHVELASFCQEIGIYYLCTPFSLSAARELEKEVNPQVYKIGSGEMLDFPTISGIAEFGKPIIVSTGMSSIEEVDLAYQFMSSLGIEFAMLNCTSSYPAELRDTNIGFLADMRNRYPEAIVGSSDHMPNGKLGLIATALGSRIIEKHITDGGSELGPDTESSISLTELAEMVVDINDVFSSLNSRKEVKPSEEEIRHWAHRSIVYTRTILAGEAVSKTDVWGKRPGTGVPSRFMDEFIGRRLRRDVQGNTLLRRDDFEGFNP